MAEGSLKDLFNSICASYDVDPDETRNSNQSPDALPPALLMARSALAFEASARGRSKGAIGEFLNISPYKVGMLVDKYRDRAGRFGLPLYRPGEQTASADAQTTEHAAAKTKNDDWTKAIGFDSPAGTVTVQPEPPAESSTLTVDTEPVDTLNPLAKRLLDLHILNFKRWPDVARIAYQWDDVPFSELLQALQACGCATNGKELASWLSAGNAPPALELDPAPEAAIGAPAPAETAASAQAVPQNDPIPRTLVFRRPRPEPITAPSSDDVRDDEAVREEVIKGFETPEPRPGEGIAATVRDIQTIKNELLRKAAESAPFGSYERFRFYGNTPGPNRTDLVDLMLEVHEHRRHLPKRLRKRVKRVMAAILDQWARSEEMFSRPKEMDPASTDETKAA